MAFMGLDNAEIICGVTDFLPPKDKDLVFLFIILLILFSVTVVQFPQGLKVVLVGTVKDKDS